MGTETGPSFGERLRRARREAGFTQEALAEHAGISVRAVSDLERGINRAPHRETLTMLADALDLPAGERQQWEQIRRRAAVRSSAQVPVASRPRSGSSRGTITQPVTQFFGRTEEMEHLTHLLREADVSLVTLVGSGGSGKTRIAIEVASLLANEYRHGVSFVDLSPVRDPERALSTIGAALEVRVRTDQDPGTTLAEWIGTQHILLVLDNCEQVLGAAPAIGRLLAACENLQVLATSRAPLRLRAEHEYPISPLPVPATDSVLSAQAIEQYAAVQLFLDRARAVHPGFAPGEESMRTVAGICRHLDGLPLAIELAAACTRLFPPAMILERMVQHLPLPSRGYRDAPARQQTMHDAIRWSYDLLQPDEQALLRRMSIFKGGWTMEAAEAVAGGGKATTIDVLNNTTTLIEHNLVQSHQERDISPRFTMLETIREFGLEALDHEGESNDAHLRHAEYLIDVFSGSEADWHSPREIAILERGDTESENLRLALDWTLTHNPEMALRLARELTWYWFTRGAIHEAQRWLEQALERCGAVEDDLRAAALNWVGSCATTLGDFQTAEQAQDQALTIYQQVGDEVGAALCMHSLARNAMWSGDLERAEHLYENVVGTFRKLDHPRFQTVLENLGLVLLARDNLERAMLVLDEALAVSLQRGLTWDRAAILQAQSMLAMKSGDLARARQLLTTSLLLHRETRDPRYIAQSLEDCAWLAITEGSAAHAARLLGATSTLRETIGIPVQPFIQMAYNRHTPVAKALIGSDAWDHAWSAGRSLSQTDAIELALQALQ